LPFWKKWEGGRKRFTIHAAECGGIGWIHFGPGYAYAYDLKIQTDSCFPSIGEEIGNRFSGSNRNTYCRRKKHLRGVLSQILARLKYLLC
jgi:hypothetical protein